MRTCNVHTHLQHVGVCPSARTGDGSERRVAEVRHGALQLVDHAAEVGRDVPACSEEVKRARCIGTRGVVPPVARGRRRGAAYALVAVLDQERPVGRVNGLHALDQASPSPVPAVVELDPVEPSVD